MEMNEKLMARAREKAEKVYERVGNRVFDPDMNFYDRKYIQGTTVDTMCKYGFIEKVDENIDHGVMSVKELMEELIRWKEAYEDEFGGDGEYFKMDEDGNVHRWEHLSGYRFKENFKN